MKNLKGFTLVEALAVVGISGFTASLALNVLSENQQKENLEVFSNDVASIISGFDKRVANDKFELSNWSDFSTVGYEFLNKQQVSEFLGKALIAKSAPGCGKIDGWEPIKDDPIAESYKDKYRFVDCELWSRKLPFDLNTKAQIHSENIDGVDYVKKFELDFFFDNVDDFEDNFLSLKKSISLIRNKDDSNKAGIHEYHFVSDNTGASLTSKECIDASTDCILRATFTGSSNAYETLLVNGNNNMIGSKIKFQEDVGDNAIQECHRYVESGGSWSRVDSVYCGIGFGYSDPTNLASAKLDYVELNVSSISTDRIFLGQTCTFKNITTGTSSQVPCGIYNHEATNQVVAAYDELTTEMALIEVLNAENLSTNTAVVRDQMDVFGVTTLENDLTVAGEATFSDKVLIEGDVGETNLTVNSSALMQDVDVQGSLNVQGVANVTGNVAMVGNLDIGQKLSAKRVKLSTVITSSDLGDNCNNSAYGNGSIVYYKQGDYSDLAVCANNKWKLVNTQYDQIVAFDGSCPSGFEDYDQADGRTLVGTGSLYDAASGETISYGLGDVGGQSKVGLTTDEMPSHKHSMQDAYFSEHWGSYGSNLPGSNGGQDNDNKLYTRTIQSEEVGGSQAHENRMPYYVVNWCIYKG